MSKRNRRELQDLGWGMYLVTLTSGKYAFISAQDAELIDGVNWSAQRGKNDVWYARYAGGPYMHRLIMKPPPGYTVDHINLDGLDNTRENMRIASYSENNMNLRRRRDNTSGFKGVSYTRDRDKWYAYVDAFGKRTRVGYFDSLEEAVSARAAAMKAFHGNFARTA